MIDTSVGIEQRYQEMLMQCPPERRVKMACSMFEAAKQIVRSSILEENPSASIEEINTKIFMRFYGQDLDIHYREKILGFLKREAIK